VFDNPTTVLRPTDIFDKVTKFSQNAKEVVVQSGDLVLFPSWVWHYTDPNTSGKRCVVSFDAQISKT
jgi:ectoine hydroxylase-related dioxygenase (phytanoyl-CoA dioxygenase family)